MVVGVAGIEQADDGGIPRVKGAALIFEMAAYSACDAVFVYFANILKTVAGPGAPVIPLFKELLVSGPVGARASGPSRTAESTCAITNCIRGRRENTELVSYPMPAAKR